VTKATPMTCSEDHRARYQARVARLAKPPTPLSADEIERFKSTAITPYEHRLVATLDDLTARLAQFEWRPIETAPSEEAILVYGGDCEYAASASKYIEDDEELWLIDGAQNAHGEIARPTHWMPLPKPPEEPKP
jgi:hypothetical protein